MSSASISEYLEKILKEEAINYEINAIYLIAKSANGSMRDALSILDQGIAYCGGAIEEATIKKMLGAIDQSYLFNLTHAVIDQDGSKVIEIAKEKIDLQHKINLLKVHKERIEESKKVYENDLKLFNLFSICYTRFFSKSIHSDFIA
jgi:DNA polymerase III gamma/tau subunit